MLSVKLSDSFQYNILFWKLSAIWPGKKWTVLYALYSIVSLGFLLVFYNILLTINLICAPRIIEVLLREVIFYFTEIALSVKVIMVLGKRQKIFEMFEMLDSELFTTNDTVGLKIRQDSKKRYIFGWKAYLVTCHNSFIFLTFAPLFQHLIFGEKLSLPISNYFFLSDETRDKYVYPLFLYQSLGIYSQMTFNINCDTFVWGIMYMAVSQFELLNNKLRQMNDKAINDGKNMEELIHCLKHYEILLKYCSTIESVVGLTLFMQFSMSSIIICVVLGGLVLTVPTLGAILSMCFYLSAMIAEIFIPCWLGSEIMNKSQDLVSAVYHSDWLKQSLKFKKSMNLFSVRANKQVVLYAFKIFPVSLKTFSSIMKMNYSLFTLVRHVQDKQTI